MRESNFPVRLAAAAIATVAWVGLGAQLAVSAEVAGSVPAAIWEILRFFTIIANLLAAIAFTAIAIGPRRADSSFVLGGLSLALLLVGVVHFLLLSNVGDQRSHSELADVLLHGAMPVLTPYYWFALTPKGSLRLRDPWLWALLPIGYLLYALVRASIDGKYPYPFIDAAAIGWGRTALNALIIAIGFMVAGWGLVWLDLRLGRDDRAEA